MSGDFDGDSVFGAPAPASGAAPPFDLHEHLRTLLRRKWLILAIFVLGSASAGTYAYMQKDVYTAEAVLMIERRSQNVLNIQDVLVESPQSMDFYNTQYEILKSRSLAAQVIRKERLPFSAGTYRQLLNVQPVRLSRLVRLQFMSGDPELSARVANAHAQAFIQRGLALRREASDGARGFLFDTLADLDKRLEESEASLAKFRREHGVMSVEDGSNLAVNRLAALSARLMDTESDRIARGTLLAQIRSGDTQSTSVFATDPQIVQLRKEIRTLRAQQQSGRSYTPGLEDEVEQLEQQVRAETQRVVKALEADYRNVEALEKRLRSELSNQQFEMLGLKDASVEYAMLAREADATRQLYEAVSTREKELEMAAELRSSNVFVIDEATPASEPDGSSRWKLFAMGTAGALLGGIGLALALEFIDNTIKTPTDIENLLGIPYLGTIPDIVRELPKLEQSGETELLTQGPSRVLPLTLPATTSLRTLAEIPRDVLEAREAYLSVRTNLLLSQAGAPPSPVLFTSARRGDGKTLTVLNLAVSLAQMGAPVLVIDADLRRPSCHDVLGVERDVGLTEVLAGQCEFAQAVRPIKAPLFFLGSGLQAPPDPIELLASERMKAVLTEASLDYAYVLIDAPPLLAVSDSVALSPLVDGVILVVSNNTPKPIVAKACARLNYARARILGAVLNGFDPKATGEEYVNYYEV